MQSVLKEWKAARELLSDTIQSYVAACTNLRNSCASISHIPSQHSTIEEACTAVDYALQSLASDEQTLYDARMSLGTVRNQSVALVQVNTLPPEILATIFALSKIRCARDYGFKDYDFSATCVRWRQISLNTPNLWTHIDISSRTSVDIIEILLERTNNSLVHIHLREFELNSIARNPMPQHKIEQIASLISPHAHRIQTLNTVSHDESRDLADAVLDVWLAHGQANLSRSLLAHHVAAGVRSTITNLPGRIKQRRSSEGALISLRRLHLTTVTFDWEFGAYHNLVDLRIEFHSHRQRGVISVSHFARVLSTSTKISILKLRYVSLTSTADWSHDGPIALDRLKVLSLSSLDNQSMKSLLPLLSLSIPGAECAIAGLGFEAVCSELAGFFTRSQITTLYFCPGEPRAFLSWPPLLGLYPHMQTLVLGFQFFSSDAYIEQKFQSPDLVRSAGSSTVILTSCVVTLFGLRELIDHHGILDLRLDKCSSNPQTTPATDLPNMQATLLREYPKLKCSISDLDSTSQLACRTMFDTYY